MTQSPTTFTPKAIAKLIPIASPIAAIVAGLCLAMAEAEMLAALMLGGGLVGIGVLLGQRQTRLWRRQQ